MLALGDWLKTRTRLQRIMLVLVAVAGFNRMLGWTTGYEIIGGSILEFCGALALILFVLNLARRPLRTLFWGSRENKT